MAQKEYLKMADVFTGKVEPERFTYASISREAAEYAAHAINSHDELVADVERLRGALSFVHRQVCALELSMKSNSDDSCFHGELLTNIRCVSA